MTLAFPELATGTAVQYPLRVQRGYRTTRIESRGGTVWRAEDPQARTISWRLTYRGLSDAEAQAIWDLHSTASGRLRPFTFIDPTANLLRWSADLDNDVWRSHGLLLSNADGGWQARNATQGEAELVQTIAGRADRTYCLSVVSDRPVRLFLRAGTDILAKDIEGAGFISGRLQSHAAALEAGVVFGSGGATIRDLQLEAQGVPSEYRRSWAAGGIYPETHFRDDRLLITTDGPGNHRTEVELTSRI